MIDINAVSTTALFPVVAFASHIATTVIGDLGRSMSATVAFFTVFDTSVLVARMIASIQALFNGH